MIIIDILRFADLERYPLVKKRAKLDLHDQGELIKCAIQKKIIEI